MLALVKKPHIEIALHGERIEEFLDWIRQKYDVSVLTDDLPEESVPIESTEYWKNMERNRVGNLLTGARLKAGLTQAKLASKAGIRQNMVSDYERGYRVITPDMASRLAEVLNVREEILHASTTGSKEED